MLSLALAAIVMLDTTTPPPPPPRLKMRVTPAAAPDWSKADRRWERPSADAQHFTMHCEEQTPQTQEISCGGGVFYVGPGPMPRFSAALSREKKIITRFDAAGDIDAQWLKRGEILDLIVLSGEDSRILMRVNTTIPEINPPAAD